MTSLRLLTAFWNLDNGVDFTPGSSWHFQQALLASYGLGRAWR
jgi:hypothetical protein